MILTGLPWLYPTGMKLYTPVLPVTNPSARYSIWQEGTARKKDWFQQASKELNPQLIVQHILCLLIHTFYVCIYHSYKLDWAAEHPLKPIPWCGIWKFSTPDPNSHPEMRKGLRHWSFIGCTLQHSCKSLANHWKCWYHTVNMSKVHSSCNCFVILRFVLCMTFTLGYVGASHS